MPNPSSISAYDDVKAVLDAAIDRGEPLRYVCANPGAAIRWRSRANSFRKLSSVTAYKTLVFRISKASPETVIIDREVPGQLQTHSGEVIPLTIPEPTMTDEERAAFDLAREFGVE